MSVSSSVEEHREKAPSSVSVAIITCSTSRYASQKRGLPIDDPSGDLIESLVLRAGHKIASRVLISDSQRDLEHEIRKAARSRNVDSVIICGGTGIAKRDVTIEVAERLLEKSMPGFGETFRRLSYDRVGSAAVLSRTLAGVLNGKVVFCLPGSIDAVQLAMTKLIVPEIRHMVKHAAE